MVVCDIVHSENEEEKPEGKKTTLRIRIVDVQFESQKKTLFSGLTPRIIWSIVKKLLRNYVAVIRLQGVNDTTPQTYSQGTLGRL